jgi:uncharacterized membrane protein
MSLTTLKDDLLQEFREERIMINEQVELLDPLATQLRKPAAQRLLSSSTLIISEFICYITSMGGVAFVAFMHKIYPFNQLGSLFYDASYRNKIGSMNMMYLILGIYGLAAIGVILVFIIGRMAREIRLKNEILSMAGKDIKTIVGQHLERKAALDTIEQRHALGASHIGIGQPIERQKEVPVPSTPFRATGAVRASINEIRNPGFQ